MSRDGTDNSPASAAWLEVVRRAAEGLRFGSIQIKIHDGEIVQIEATQKLRAEDFSVLAPTLFTPTANAEASRP